MTCSIDLEGFWVQAPSVASSRPAYPSSMAKRQPVEWDKLAADVKKEEEEEKPDGEAGLQKLFRSVGPFPAPLHLQMLV